MSEAFHNVLTQEFQQETIRTENGAVGYATSASKLVDFFYRLSSYRNCDEAKIAVDFQAAWAEDARLALKLLFLAGDVREGIGERRVFRAGLRFLANEHPEKLRSILPLVPIYSRWDVLVELCEHPAVADAALALVRKQLAEDQEQMRAGKPISLLAKWMPSCNTSSPKTRALARKLIGLLDLKEPAYRKLLARLRAYLKVVETQMSANQWSEIDYSAVPSKANLLYRNAFLRHDPERRANFLQALKNGAAKINSAVAFPYDIVHRYMQETARDRQRLQTPDPALEEMWNALPDYVVEGQGAGTLCVVDGSASMSLPLGRTSVTCHDVARGLAIYFAERLQGAFRNHFITFSERPQLVSLEGCNSLMQKINVCIAHDECANTNIERTFDLILRAAVNSNLPQEELPGTILVLSDMEFDECTEGNHGDADAALFEVIRKRFAAKGYRLPRMVFWNICSRTGAMPLQVNPAGVALVSGFSPAIASMVFSEKLDPLAALMEKLDSKRYRPLDIAFIG